MKRWAVVPVMLMLILLVLGVSQGADVTHDPTKGTSQVVSSPLGPYIFFVSMEGVRQGKITTGTFTEKSVGNVYIQGHEDEIMGLSFDWGIYIPRDPLSGQPVGQRVHQPMSFIKLADKSSPLLLNAVTSNERMKKVLFKFYRLGSDKTMQHYFTIELQDAIIVSMRTFSTYDLQEEITFTYRKIITTHVKAGTTGADDWRSPKA